MDRGVQFDDSVTSEVTRLPLGLWKSCIIWRLHNYLMSRIEKNSLRSMVDFRELWPEIPLVEMVAKSEEFFRGSGRIPVENIDGRGVDSQYHRSKIDDENQTHKTTVTVEEHGKESQSVKQPNNKFLSTITTTRENPPPTTTQTRLPNTHPSQIFPIQKTKPFSLLRSHTISSTAHLPHSPASL